MNGTGSSGIEPGFDQFEETALAVGPESERAQADAASKILDPGCGKPTQPVDGRLDVTYHVRDQPMPLDEWRRTFTDE
jgi:hypothetical protein